MQNSRRARPPPNTWCERKASRRRFGSILPYAVREFANADLEWLLHRQIYTRAVDVVQLEYTALGQYHWDFHRIACLLFEHDIYFQSIGRGLAGTRSVIRKMKATFEYLRALRYELKILPQFDRIQVCSPENGDYLLRSFQPWPASWMTIARESPPDGMNFHTDGREPRTHAFSRKLPPSSRIMEALDWFTRKVLPWSYERSPDARLIIVGARSSTEAFPAGFWRRPRVARICGRRPRAALALRRIRLPHSQRLRHARQTSGSFRRRNSSSLDQLRSRRADRPKTATFAP